MSERLVNVYRGSIVESRHYGDLAIVDKSGILLWSVGDPNRVTYARSSAKPMQALPLVESGAAEYFHMTDEEVALCCASHSGEAQHVDQVRAFLSRIGVSESDLKCGAHAPYHASTAEQLFRSGASPEAIHNNCSGKHSGMLALAKFLGADLDGYLNLDHPVQRMILDAVSEMCETPKDQIPVGVDGCGVPVFGLSVSNMALAFAKFADPSRLNDKRRQAVKRIANAMMSYPFLVAGSDRFCTSLMGATDKLIVGKAGAEGVYCAGLVNQGWGICVKIDDGNARAAYPAVVEALVQAGGIDIDTADKLKAFHHPEVKNHQGTMVGRLTPEFQLKKH